MTDPFAEAPMERHRYTSMRKVVYEEFGDRDVCQLVDCSVPEPQAGQVLIKVHGAGLPI